MEGKTAGKLQEWAYRSWFAGLACNALAGLYQLFRLRQRRQGVSLKEGEGVVEAKRIKQ